MLTNDELRGLADNKFSLDCNEIVLTQCGSSSPIIWKGPGTLSMSEAGQLQVKVFLSNEVDAFDSLFRSLESQSPAGTLLEDSEYFDMVARDYMNHEWKAVRFLVHERLYQHTSSGTVTANLRKITKATTAPTASSHRLVATVRGRPKIPYTTMVAQADGSMTRTGIDLTLRDGTEVQIRGLGHVTSISMEQSSQPLTPTALSLITEAISIGTGHRLTRLYESRTTGNEQTTSIWSACDPVDRKASDLFPLFDQRMSPSFCAFVQDYVDFKHNTPNGFYDCWQKVYDAWQLGAIAAALPLAVNIEGVIAEFFPDKRVESPDFAAQVDSVIAIVKASGTNDAVVARCVGALTRIKEKSATQALRSLAADGWFSLDLVKAWGAIRHKSAHGHDIAKANANLQTLLDDTLKCLQLFCLLLLIRMRFRHEFKDLASHGFPTVRLADADPAIT